jgi:hypothetical protein
MGWIPYEIRNIHILIRLSFSLFPSPRGSVVGKDERLHDELVALEQRMRRLDHDLADALYRIRHSSSPDDMAKAREDERALLAQLDRLMTRRRAVEGQLLQAKKGATLH